MARLNDHVRMLRLLRLQYLESQMSSIQWQMLVGTTQLCKLEVSLRKEQLSY